MNRQTLLQRLNTAAEEGEPAWDIVIIGGGATGVGIAVDAASRGYQVLLLEQSDFGKGTSSRSTKLVHGGVRYLKQGNISLVTEALKERGILRHNAPHLVDDLAFIVPNYDWWEAPFYGVGLKLYDLLAGRYGFGPSKLLSREATIEKIPTIETDGLRGGVLYYDGQFDDARLLINLVTTALEQGATLLNYVQVTGFATGDDGLIRGVRARELESGRDLDVSAKVVINATGAYTDGVRRLVDPKASTMIAPSQGAHVVLDGSFLAGDSAIMVPKTSDGRVLFVIPWHSCALLGTTDTPLEDTPLEPRPQRDEVEFILETAAQYLTKDPTPDDVRSVFAGIRPLVRSSSEDDTAALSRDHAIHIDRSGLLTIAGGKWTTYRKMAEDAVDQAALIGGLEERPCITKDLNIHGYHQHAAEFGELAFYGSDAPALQDLIDSDAKWSQPLHAELPSVGGEVLWAVREEAARTVEDVLSRRTRCLLFNAKASVEAAPTVASIMAEELGHPQGWVEQQVERFTELAAGYQVSGGR